MATVNETATTIVSLPNGIAVREFRLDDAASHSKHMNNKNVWNNMRNRIPQPYTEADSIWWINHCHDKTHYIRSGPWSPETGSAGPSLPPCYAITIHDQCVGGIGLEFGTDVYFRSAELGYWLGEEFWGQGVMGLVVQAFVGWVWRTFGRLVRLDGRTFEWNGASGRVLGRAGFGVEGRREGAVVKNGRIGAECMWGALRPV